MSSPLLWTSSRRDAYPETPLFWRSEILSGDQDSVVAQEGGWERMIEQEGGSDMWMLLTAREPALPDWPSVLECLYRVGVAAGKGTLLVAEEGRPASLRLASRLY